MGVLRCPDSRPNRSRTKPIHVYRPPPLAPLTVRYRDEHLVVVDKVSGLLTVPGRGAERQDCLLRRLQRDDPGALVVHRLDMETSGLVMFARSRAAQSALGRMFQRRQVDKRYVALVRAVPAAAEGQIELPLITDWPNRPRQKVDCATGRPAHTRYQVVATDPAGAWARVALVPITGRSHQLRVHMAAIGHPLLGDTLYADAQTLRMADRLMLHAEALVLDHPLTGTRLELFSAPPF